MKCFVHESFVRSAWIGFGVSLLVVPASFIIYDTLHFLTLMVAMLVGFVVSTTLYVILPRPTPCRDSFDLLILSCVVWAGIYAWIWPGYQNWTMYDAPIWQRLLQIAVANWLSYGAIYIALLAGSILTIGIRASISRNKESR